MVLQFIKNGRRISFNGFKEVDYWGLGRIEK